MSCTEVQQLDRLVERAVLEPLQPALVRVLLRDRLRRRLVRPRQRSRRSRGGCGRPCRALKAAVISGEPRLRLLLLRRIREAVGVLLARLERVRLADVGRELAFRATPRIS